MKICQSYNVSGWSTIVIRSKGNVVYQQTDVDKENIDEWFIYYLKTWNASDSNYAIRNWMFYEQCQ